MTTSELRQQLYDALETGCNYPVFDGDGSMLDYDTYSVNASRVGVYATVAQAVEQAGVAVWIGETNKGVYTSNISIAHIGNVEFTIYIRVNNQISESPTFSDVLEEIEGVVENIEPDEMGQKWVLNSWEENKDMMGSGYVTLYHPYGK